MLNDPAICKIIIFGLVGIIIVLLIALFYLGIKKNTYYVDEDGNEILPKETKPIVKKETKEPIGNKMTSLLEKAKEIAKPIDDVPAGDETVVMKTMLRKNKPVKGLLVNVIVNGLEQQKEINGFPCTIGRDDGNDLVISEPAVSRRHAQFIVSGNHLFIEDVSGHNGVLVNGIRITAEGKEKIREKDHIELGRAEIDIINVFYED